MNWSKHLSFIVIFLLISWTGFAQTTVVKGLLKDADSGEPMGFATIIWQGTYIGAESEYDGTFEIRTDDPSLTALEFSFMGYETKVVQVEPGKVQEIVVEITEEGTELVVVDVVASRPKKDTAAIALFRRVVKAKEKLRESQYDYYQYEDYTKMEFDLFNVKEKFTKRKILKPFDFVFENMDTTQDGKAFLPVLLKEKISDIYYRKSPKREKEVVKADQFSGVDNKEFFALTDYAFPDVDIYDKTVQLGDKAFINPFSAGALGFYKYFLEDSTTIGKHFCYKLDFSPRRKGDLAFTGSAWVDKETAMIKSIQIDVLEQINVNFLTGLEIRQDFEEISDGNWFKVYERMEVMMNLLENKKRQAVRVIKTATRKDVVVNVAIPEEKLSGDFLEIDKLAYKRDTSYWAQARHEELTEHEAAIYSNMAKVRKTSAYKTYNYLGNAFSSGYLNVGKVEVGRIFQFVSWNGLEGNRYRLGLRAAPKFFRDKFSADGYVAYGDKDELFKYHIGGSLHLKSTNGKWHQIGGHYRYDWSDYNFANPYMTHDHILNSIMRGEPLTNLFLIREGYAFYDKEWIKGLSNKFSFKHRRVYSWQNSAYDTGEPNGEDSFEAVEMGVRTTWGPGQLFVNRQGGGSRQAVDITAPVFTFDYRIGLDNFLGGDYGYQVLNGSMRHKITSRVGQTFYTIGATKILGDVPVPLLSIPKGNVGYLYNRHTYNMMNDLEFVNDTEVTFEARHFFDGFLMNMIPGVRRLKLRTMLYGKAIYGNITAENQALLGDTPLRSLDGVYAESGVGILNIFKFIQIYGFMRHTQLDTPGASRFGFKFMLGVSL